MENGKLILILAKLVDDIFIIGDNDLTGEFNEYLILNFQSGSLVSGPGEFQVYDVTHHTNG